MLQATRTQPLNVLQQRQQPCSLRLVQPPQQQQRTATAAATQRHRELQQQRWRPLRRQCACAALAKAGVKHASSSAAVGAAALEQQLPFLARGLADVLLPLAAGWIAVKLLHALAARAHKWVDEHPDEPLSIEALGLLPAALESPSRVAITILALTRALRNSAGLLQAYAEAYQPRYNEYIESAVTAVTRALVPLDAGLIKLYTVVAAVLVARVLIKWKHMLLHFVLESQRSRDGASTGGLSAMAGSDSSGGSGGSFVYTAGGSSGGSSAALGSRDGGAAQRSRDGAGAGAGGAGEVRLEGGVLSVAMRPRLPSGGGDEHDHDSDDSDGELRGMLRGRGLSGASNGSSSGSGSSSGGGGFVAGAPSSSSNSRVRRAAKSTEQLERLLLPLDSILSWLLVVAAGLFCLRVLGVNIQPLLAVGGASGLIIGLATQQLLTNAMMGLSIFLSRPFITGDSVTVQGIGNIIISGIVTSVTPLRTMMRTDEDVLVSVPNKTVAEMVIYNRSKPLGRNRLTDSMRRTAKFKVKLPHKEVQQLEPLQADLHKALRRPGVSQQSVRVTLSRFTDVGAELLVKFRLLVPHGSAEAQRLLLDLSLTVRERGATIVSIL